MEVTGVFVPDWDDDDEDTTAAPQAEPGLLTHGHTRAASDTDTDFIHEARSDGGSDDEPGDPGSGSGTPRRRRRRRRRVRRLVLACILLLLLAPIVAFLVGWQLYDVPSPAQLEADRKQVTTLYFADGTTEIGRIVPEQGNRIEVDIDEVPVHVQNAVLSAEDRSFRSNPGFDIIGIARAAWNQLTGGTGGGSTITQQYVKVATGDDEFSLMRKYREVIIAAKMTRDYPKDQILQDYLNTIYFGRGAYGIEAASHAYFNKPVQELTVEEGAVLAGLIQAPSAWDPAQNREHSEARWNFVLDGMVAEGWLDAGTRATMTFPVVAPPPESIPGTITGSNRHILTRALTELEAQGISREQLHLSGGRIVTTIDPRAQQIARDTVVANMDGQPENLRSALVAVDPRTGGIRAYYGGEEGTGYDLAGGIPHYPGSTFKPFGMLAALREGIGLGAMYNGNSPMTVGGIQYHNSESASYSALTLREAMTRSVNTAFVQLAYRVGAQAVADAAYDAGIPREINGEPTLAEPNNSGPGLGVVLGQYPVRVVDMASAYATFAADGMYRPPHIVSEYVDADDRTVYQHEESGAPAFDPNDREHNTQLARNVTASMLDVANYSQLPLADGRQVACKTGTAQYGNTGENAAAWMAGYTPSFSSAVWVGDPSHAPIRDSSGSRIYGADLPGEIWQEFMSTYLEGTEKERFPSYEPIGSASGPAQQEATRSPEPEQPTEQAAPPPPPPPAPETELPEPTQPPERPTGPPEDAASPPPSSEPPTTEPCAFCPDIGDGNGNGGGEDESPPEQQPSDGRFDAYREPGGY